MDSEYNRIMNVRIANICKAKRSGTNVSLGNRANICGTNIIQTNISGANITGVNINGAKEIDIRVVDGANLIGANIRPF
ncbi:unnamed protein product [Gordionus sp. m RMFG-2023]